MFTNGSLLCSGAHSGGSVLGNNARLIETSPLPAIERTDNP